LHLLTVVSATMQGFQTDELKGGQAECMSYLRLYLFDFLCHFSCAILVHRNRVLIICYF